MGVLNSRQSRLAVRQSVRDAGAAILGLWTATNRSIVANAGAMIATTVVTSALGAAYWLLAARFFTQEVVGLAGASVSAMSLLGIAGTLGLGTLLIGELPRQRDNAAALLVTALLVAGGGASVAASAFALIIPLFSDNLRPLGTTVGSVALFAFGAGLAGLTLVLDQGLMGLLRGGVQLGRNVVFAVVKLGALLVIGFWMYWDNWAAIYATWVFGNAISLLFVAGSMFRSGMCWQRPRWGILRRFRGTALLHHGLNLALWVPGFAMPIMATALLSPTANAYFYIASMVAGFVFAPPLALTTALYAVGARTPAALAQRLRLTLVLALVAGLAANLLLVSIGPVVLGFFGRDYAEQSVGMLRIIALIVFPIIIKDHYVAIHRISGRLSRAAALIAIGSMGELAGATFGTIVGGLPGLALGWLIASCLQAAVMCPVVYTAIRGGASLRAEPLGDAQVVS